MMFFLWQRETYLWYLPGTPCLCGGPSPVDLACLRNHLLHARRYWYCGCHPQDTAVGRDRTHYSFSSIRAVVHGLSSNMRSKLVGLRRIVLVYICIFYATRTTRYNFSHVLVWYVYTRRRLHQAKQGCGVVSCTAFSRAGPKCSYSYDSICMYVRIVTFNCYQVSFSRCLVVDSRYDFFFGFIKSWKTSAVSTTVWMVETQLCKLRGTSDMFV